MKITKNDIVLEREGEALEVFLKSGWVEFVEEVEEVEVKKVKKNTKG